MHSVSAATGGHHDSVQRTDTRRSTRIRSCAIGATVGALVGAWPLAVGVTDRDGLATLVVAGLVGAPVGAILGWRTAAKARAGLMFFGLPALMLTIPAAIVWIVIVRAIPAELLDGRRSDVVST